MQITGAELKQIIKEELEAVLSKDTTINEINWEKKATEIEAEEEEAAGLRGGSLDTGEAIRTARKEAVGLKGQGIKPEERSIIQKINKALVNGAKETNIAQGKIFRYLQLVFEELQGILDKSPAEE